MDLEKFAWDVFVKGIITLVLSAVPFLAGPLGAIAAWLITKAGEWLWARTGAMWVIQFRNERAQKEFDAASVKLAIIAHEKGVTSEEFKAQRALHVDALAKYVRFA